MKYRRLTENKRKEVLGIDFDKEARIGMNGDESQNWIEDGRVTGQNQERGSTPLFQTHGILNEREAA